MPEFKPVLYLKASCPFCLKVAAFLSEIGAFDKFELRQFWPDEDDQREAPIRAELAAHFEQASFPTVQYAPGKFLNESDAIIAHYADCYGIDAQALPFYRYVIEGPIRRMREQFRTINELSERLSAEA